MENQIFHTASSRGYADHNWLKSYHSFSFGSYYNPERMSFGVLRVLNDDIVSGGMGFGRHGHSNMEIISIPLEGDLEHSDNMGNTAVISQGDIQVMSAGTGIEHSEKNKRRDQPVKFLQIWIIPNKMNVTPRYDQLTLQEKDRLNKFQQILSPDPGDEGVWIHQDAWFHLGKFDKDFEINYSIKKPDNGVYIFLLSGEIMVGSQHLSTRDGFGVWNIANIEFKALENSEVLLMEVPMEV